MEEKDDKIRHLEEINVTLKQTNDDLTEEVAELKRQVAELNAKVCGCIYSVIAGHVIIM